MDIDGYGSIGFYNVAILSLFCGGGTFVSTHIMNKVGPKWCLCISAASNSIWILSTIFASQAYE